MTIAVPQISSDSRDVVTGVDENGDFIFEQVKYTDLDFSSLTGFKTTSTSEATIQFGKQYFTLDTDDERMKPGVIVQCTAPDRDCWIWGVVLAKDYVAEPSRIQVATLRPSPLTGTFGGTYGGSWEIQIVSGPILGFSPDATIGISSDSLTVPAVGQVITANIGGGLYVSRNMTLLFSDAVDFDNNFRVRVLDYNESTGDGEFICTGRNANSGDAIEAWIVSLIPGPVSGSGELPTEATKVADPFRLPSVPASVEGRGRIGCYFTFVAAENLPGDVVVFEDDGASGPLYPAGDGSQIDLSTNTTLGPKVVALYAARIQTTAANSGDLSFSGTTVTSTGTVLAPTGASVRPVGTWPASITVGQMYYLRKLTSLTFSLHTSFDDANTGTDAISYASSPVGATLLQLITLGPTVSYGMADLGSAIYPPVGGVPGTTTMQLEFNLAADLPNSSSSGPATTSYANTDGTGNRTGTITITQSGITIASGTINNLIDGANAANSTDAVNWSATPAAGSYIRFQFGSARYIDEFTWKQPGATGSIGTWKFRGSNDASTWTDLGSSFALGGSASQVVSTTHTSPAAYTYYQLEFVSGTVTSNWWNGEIEFKIATSATETVVTIEAAAELDVANMYTTAPASHPVWRQGIPSTTDDPAVVKFTTIRPVGSTSTPGTWAQQGTNAFDVFFRATTVP